MKRFGMLVRISILATIGVGGIGTANAQCWACIDSSCHVWTDGYRRCITDPNGNGCLVDGFACQRYKPTLRSSDGQILLVTIERCRDTESTPSNRG